MTDNKKNIKHLIILVISLILISCSTFAFDKVQNVRIMLRPTGPIFSPRGDKIVFDFKWTTNDKVGSDIGIFSLKSDEIKIITKFAVESLNESSCWSKDSKHILFKSSRKDGAGLFFINSETLKEDIIFFLQYDEDCENKKCTEISNPIFFPLSDKIVFIKSIFDRDTIEYLGYLYDLKEKKGKEIAKGISNSVIFRRTWSVSYSGNDVFYTKKNDKYNDIWLSDLRKNSNGEQQLTKGYDVTYLKASPVKNEILFVAKGKNKSSWALYKLNLKTRKEEKLIGSNNYNFGFPSWSRDGSSIVFVNGSNINIIDVNKGKITAELRVDMETIAFPILTKDGRIIFYQKYSSIWSVDIGGKNLKRIFPTNLKSELNELKGTSLPE